MEHQQLYEIGGVKLSKEQIIDFVERYPPMPFEPYNWGGFKSEKEYRKEQKKKKTMDQSTQFP
jgi:hypothetical protein